MMILFQSADDGTVGLIKGMMDTTDNVEEGVLYGPTSTKGDAVALPSEPYETDPKSKTMLWKKSEEAIGASFDI